MIEPPADDYDRTSPGHSGQDVAEKIKLELDYYL